VTVEFRDIESSPITEIAKGNAVKVEARHELVTPLNTTCILILPVTNPAYKERMIEAREYTGSAGGEWFYFYIPPLGHISGTAVALVIVQGAGVGYATLTVD